jgi:hypothetical protein
MLRTVSSLTYILNSFFLLSLFLYSPREGTSQTYLFPTVGANYSQIGWSDRFAFSYLDTAFMLRPTVGIGVERITTRNYVIRFRTIYSNRTTTLSSNGSLHYIP